MKSFNLFFTVLLVSALFAFTSCGDDDPEREKTSMEKVYTYSIAIQGIATQPQSNVKTTLKLSAALGETTSKDLISGEFQRGKSSLTIKGLKDVEGENVQLSDFKIKIGNGTEVNLGTCTANSSAFESDVEYSSDKYTNIISPLFAELVKNKQADVYISFTPSHTITTGTAPVTLEIKVGGQYLYYKPNL